MLAVVAEEILGEGTVEDVAEFLGHLQVGFDIDAEPLEFVGLVAGADAEHQAPVRERVGGCNLGRKPRRVELSSQSRHRLTLGRNVAR